MKKTCLLFCACLLWVTYAFAVVNPGVNNIQAAINQAAPGSVVTLAAGTFEVSETIVINKKIILKGAGKGATILKKTNAATADIVAIWVNADGVTLQDFTINGQGRGGPGIIVKSNSNKLTNLGVNNCGNNNSKRSGLLFDTAHLNTLSNVTANNNRMVGISQSSSSDNVLNNCTADNNGAEGLTIDNNSHNCHVTNSQFNGNNNRGAGVGGIGIDKSNGAILDRCTIDGTSVRSGITFQNNLGGDDGCVIRNCTITNSAEWAIRVRNCTYQVTNTSFVNNTYRANGLGAVKWDCPPPARLSYESALVTQPAAGAYLNPTTGLLSVVVAPDIHPLYLQIFSMDGRTVFTQSTFPTTVQEQTISVSQWKSGVYVYVVGYEGGTLNGKFVIP